MSLMNTVARTLITLCPARIAPNRATDCSSITDYRMSIDTDGIRDKCSECGGFTRAVKLVGGWVIDCMGCDNGYHMPCESENEAGWAWNKQEREKNEARRKQEMRRVQKPSIETDCLLHSLLQELRQVRESKGKIMK